MYSTSLRRARLRIVERVLAQAPHMFHVKHRCRSAESRSGHSRRRAHGRSIPSGAARTGGQAVHPGRLNSNCSARWRFESVAAAVCGCMTRMFHVKHEIGPKPLTATVCSWPSTCQSLNFLRWRSPSARTWPSLVTGPYSIAGDRGSGSLPSLPSLDDD